MDARTWDERYAATEQAWSSEPNAFVVTMTQGLVPGTAIDLGTGEGRNARWLAKQGWTVTAVDFSAVAIDRARSGPDADQIDWQVADLTTHDPGRQYDLVLAAYLHLPPPLTRPVLRRAASWVAPTGRLVVVSHAVRNAAEGVGGPPDPAVLHDEALLRDIATGLTIERLDEVERRTAQGTAIDVVLRARREG